MSRSDSSSVNEKPSTRHVGEGFMPSRDGGVATVAVALIVEDRHLEDALRALVLGGGDLTRSLLGFPESTEHAAQDGTSSAVDGG